MPFIPAVDTAQLAVHFLQDGQRVENVMYVQKATGWDATTLSALSAAYKSWWLANRQGASPTNVELVEIVARDMTTSTGIEVVYTTGLPVFGTSVGLALPNNVTIAIKLNTGLGGRSFRGRQYIIGLLEGQLDTDRNTITPLAVTDLTSKYTALLGDINAVATPGLVIASFHSGGSPRTTALLTPVTSFSFSDSTLDSQRRRLPGRGR